MVEPMMLILWQNSMGENLWEILCRKDAVALIDHLRAEGTQESTMIACNASSLSWVYPETHQNSRMINFKKLNEQICQDGGVPHTPPIVPKAMGDESTYGWVSPDGRYFQCGYGGHSSLAREIVGRMTDIRDPSLHLEENGWMAIFHDPTHTAHYSLGLGKGKKISDKQLSTLKFLKIENSIRNLKLYL